ncbi:MAG: calcium/sodium antiporter [Eubacteriales bacterium]
MLIVYISLVAGFILLVKGADYFVDGASSIAKFFGMPSLVIGLTIVSIGTSAPEGAVSITAALSGSNDIAVGNLIGSNIFNTAVVVGVCAIIHAITVDKQIIKKEFPFMIICSILTGILLLDGVVSRVDGAILFVAFLTYMVNVLIYALKSKAEPSEDTARPNMIRASLTCLIGAAAIVVGGDFVVDAAQQIALSFNLSESVIALTVVALGTSLPELVTSIVAANKGESDIAIGNVIGSNIFNMLFILGLSSMISPITPSATAVIDVSVFILIAISVYLISRAKEKINLISGILLVSTYAVYTAYLFIR